MWRSVRTLAQVLRAADDRVSETILLVDDQSGTTTRRSNASINHDSGVILVANGTGIHQSLIEKLTRPRHSGTGVKGPIAVRVVLIAKLTLAS